MNLEIFEFECHGDNRGQLIALEGMRNIPFEIKRVYYMYNTAKYAVRGKHAHRNLKQMLICVNGTCTILLDDGKDKKEVILNSPTKGLYIESNIWREMYNFTDDAVLLVLASEHYDENDYIRSYDEFKKYIGEVLS